MGYEITAGYVRRYTPPPVAHPFSVLSSLAVGHSFLLLRVKGDPTVARPEVRFIFTRRVFFFMVPRASRSRGGIPVSRVSS